MARVARLICSAIRSRRRSRAASISPRSSRQSGTQSSAAAEGVGARRSATKSAIVTSVSWPTPLITGTRAAKIARATRSSLNAQRSSAEPPPRPTIITSTRSSAQRASIPATIRSGAPSPCTSDGARTSSASGKRRPITVWISCQTAPVGEVTTPIVRGIFGSGRLRPGSNRPSRSNRARNSSNASWSGPTPAGWTRSTRNWYSPRGS